MCELMNAQKSYDAQKSCLCSTCLGPVIAVPSREHKGLYAVKCANPNCASAGFVRREWNERPHKSLLVGENLAGKSEEELLRELGF